jgi:hypothetical protein
VDDFVPTNANEFIEHQLTARLKAIETCFSSDALCFVGPILDGVDDLIRIEVEDVSKKGRKSRRLSKLLTTNGGSIETVARIVETLRRHYDHIDVIVPSYAFSAGTVLAMSGDDIYMDYYSRLGPIDPQVQNNAGRWVPALGYLIQYERLLAKAQAGTLSTAEAQLMLFGFDQAELYRYEQARELSVSLLKDWLVRYKFKNWDTTETRGTRVTQQRKARRAEEIARELSNTDRWHSHGYGISMEVLRRDLKLRINDLDESEEACSKVRLYDSLLRDYMQRRGSNGVIQTVHRYVPFI